MQGRINAAQIRRPFRGLGRQMQSALRSSRSGQIAHAPEIAKRRIVDAADVRGADKCPSGTRVLIDGADISEYCYRMELFDDGRGIAYCSVGAKLFQVGGRAEIVRPNVPTLPRPAAIRTNSVRRAVEPPDVR